MPMTKICATGACMTGVRQSDHWDINMLRLNNTFLLNDNNWSLPTTKRTTLISYDRKKADIEQSLSDDVQNALRSPSDRTL